MTSLRDLCQAVVDGRDWARGRLAQALGARSASPDVIDAQARAILAAITEAEERGRREGYARAMRAAAAYADGRRYPDGPQGSRDGPRVSEGDA